LELGAASLVGDEVVATPYGLVRLEHSFPDDESSTLLFDALDVQRATQAWLWSIPLVGFAYWRDQQAEVFDAHRFGDVVVYDTLREKRGIVTANLTTPYMINFTALEPGRPLVIDYPAGATAGGILDFWQRPLTDMGLTGPDQGAGGRFVVLAPGDDPAGVDFPDAYVVASETANVFIAFRILDPEPAAMEAAKTGLRMHRWPDQGGDPVQFIEGVDREWDATPPRGLAYWECLASVLAQEPVREVDRIMIAMLEPLGLVPGRPFAPDSRQCRLLEQGAALGELMTRNIQINPRHAVPYWPGTTWYRCLDFPTSQHDSAKVYLDERAAWFYEAVTSSRGMADPQPGDGQVYMTSKRDSAGRLVRADRDYRIHIPADVPVAQFWSLTLYSEDTRRPYDNGGTEIRSVSLDSRDPALRFNDDASIDLYIGPNEPASGASNWMPTRGQGGWFPYLRLYAPTVAFFDKTWTLPDITALDD
jgi:hypothetical protein